MYPSTVFIILIVIWYFIVSKRYQIINKFDKRRLFQNVYLPSINSKNKPLQMLNASIKLLLYSNTTIFVNM